MSAIIVFRRLPVPLVSRERRTGEPPFEEQGPGRLQFFLPCLQISKVVGRCAHFWWICLFSDAKLLIVEMYSNIKQRVLSIKCSVLSIKLPVFSIVLFFGFTPSFSLFFFCKQREEREERHPPKRAANPSNRSAAYFLVHQIDFAVRAFGGNWWMKLFCISRTCDKTARNPSIHPCFPPTPLGACFYGLC